MPNKHCPSSKLQSKQDEFGHKEYWVSGSPMVTIADLAAKWLEKAAEQGDPVAMGVAGVKYLLGQGASQDVNRGLDWLWLSANSQHPHAQFVIGEALFSGDFGPDHKLQGLMWLKIAERNESKKAQETLMKRKDKLS